MATCLPAALKICSAASLGILTGVHINFSLQTMRAILALNSPWQARKAFAVALGLLRATARPLELFATTSLAAAWLVSPRYAKHPYLWYAALPLVASAAMEKMGLVSGVTYGVMATDTLRLWDTRLVGGGGVDLEAEGRGDVNGEVVRDRIDAYRRWVLLRGGFIGASFFVSLVGLHGPRGSSF